MIKFYIKVLIISILCLFVGGCKSKSVTTKKHKLERRLSTDELRDDQMDDYEEEMNQQNNQDD